jgi:hypothetical protein
MQHSSKPNPLAMPAGAAGAAGRSGRTKANADPRETLSSGSGKRFGSGLAEVRIFHICNDIKAANGPIAQLDRVTDFYSVGCRFESCWDRHNPIKSMGL